MNINYKLVAYFGGFAFIFSFLISLMSGADFLTILLRSFLGGICFAILGAGIGYAIDKFLPGLQPAEDHDEEEETTARPEEVDITLPEENPHDRPRYRRVDDLEEESEYAASAGNKDATFATPEDAADADTTEMDEEFTKSVSKGKRPPITPRTSGKPGRALAGEGDTDLGNDEQASEVINEDDEATDVEEDDMEAGEEDAGDWEDDDLQAVDDKAAGKKKAKNAGHKTTPARKAHNPAPEDSGSLAGFEGFDVDSLPSIDNFESSFSGVEPIGDQAESKEVDNIYKAAPGNSRKNVNLGGTEHNPDETAKAIRTWLKKDKEG